MIELLISATGNVIANIVVLLLIPFVWWLIFHRKKLNFFNFIGLTRPRLKRSFLVLIGFMAVYSIVYFVELPNLLITLFGDDPDVIHEIMDESGTMQDTPYKGMRFAALLPAFLVNFIANGVCEEALYRGFILKRLKGLWGTKPAILLQGVLFGLMHNALFLLGGVSVGIAYHLGIFLWTSIAGILLGILNEEVFDGESIVPSIILHGLGNYFGTIRVAFGF